MAILTQAEAVANAANIAAQAARKAAFETHRALLIAAGETPVTTRSDADTVEGYDAETGASVHRTLDSFTLDSIAAVAAYLSHNQLDASVGEETMSRLSVSSSAVQHATGTLRFGFFTARANTTVTQCRARTGGTAAAATPTICRFGLYALASNGDGTLVASTTNDTTLFSSINTNYAKALTAPYTLVKDTRYALGLVIVTAVAAPVFVGSTVAVLGNLRPRISGILTSQSNLPASFTEAGLTDTLNHGYWSVTV